MRKRRVAEGGEWARLSAEPGLPVWRSMTTMEKLLASDALGATTVYLATLPRWMGRPRSLLLLELGPFARFVFWLGSRLALVLDWHSDGSVVAPTRVSNAVRR